MGEPYYAPKEESLHAKDSAQLRKLEERDKQIKYAKKLGESIDEVMHAFVNIKSTQRSSRLKL